MKSVEVSGFIRSKPNWTHKTRSFQITWVFWDSWYIVNNKVSFFCILLYLLWPFEHVRNGTVHEVTGFKCFRDETVHFPCLWSLWTNLQLDIGLSEWLPACAPMGGMKQRPSAVCVCGFPVNFNVEASININSHFLCSALSYTVTRLTENLS